MSFTSEARLIFSAQVQALGQSLTIASRKYTETYDSAGCAVNTSTQWNSATGYTGIVQPANEEDLDGVFMPQGMVASDALRIHLRYSVTITDGDKVVFSGTSYIVRRVPPPARSHRVAVCVRYDGQRING